MTARKTDRNVWNFLQENFEINVKELYYDYTQDDESDDGGSVSSSSSSTTIFSPISTPTPSQSPRNMDPLSFYIEKHGLLLDYSSKTPLHQDITGFFAKFHKS